MIDIALQLLLILAFLAIGLIAVTFPVFALCVTYLRVEKSESEKERSSRLEDVKSKIAELTTKRQTSDGEKDLRKIDVEIKRYEAQKKSLESELGLLTAKGAVRDPLIYLAVALATAAAGIVFAEMEMTSVLVAGITVFGSVSLAFCILALLSLYNTVSRVERAALREERTIDFEVLFEGKDTSWQISQGQKVRLDIRICPEENVNNFEAWFFFPPQVNVIETAEGLIGSQPEGFAHAGYTMVFVEKTFMSKRTYWGYWVTVSCEHAGTYTLFVTVQGKGLKEREYQLVLKVV